ncbi:MAG TPA: PD-(D/E)XK nuclease family protein [Methylomirabilota bacterium]|nr:PD-(D/E)XK nuclease family protein [Methylomirabilota bacterium]
MAWTGPFQPTLERVWLDTLSGLRGGDPLAAVWLLVPSRFLGLHLSRLAARAGGAVNLHVLTFTDLADRVDEVAPLAARRLPPVGDALVLRQALREAVPDDGYFGAVRDARRFPAALAATCAELRTAGVGPGDLEHAAAVAASPASAAKLRELARIVRHADAALAGAGFAHPTDAIWIAARRAAATPVLAACAALTVYGFTDWNAAERALLSAVAARVPTACFVPLEPGPPFEPVESLVAWLAATGFRMEAGVSPRPSGLRSWVARLFHEPAPPASGPVALEVVAAPGEEREVREIARRLLAAAAEGLPFEAMGLFVRHPDAYRSAIRDVFGAAGIPYTWGVAPPLGDTRAGRSLRLLLAVRQEDFARSAVVEFLATADLREARDGHGAEPAEWDRLSREAHIVGGRADWRRGLAWLAHRAAEASGAEPAGGEDDEDGRRHRRVPAAPTVQTLGRIVGTLLESIAPLPDTAPAATFARGLLRAFLRLCRGDPEAEPIVGLLASFETLAPLATPLTLEEFAELLEAALAVPAEPGLETRQGKVFVGELHQALGLPFQWVVIPGLVEQGFPASPRTDPILLDEERRLLEAQIPGGRPGLTLAARRPAEERLAFRLAAAAAQARLVLTYPRIDPLSGRPRVPSFFLLRVAEATTGLPYDFSRLEREFAPHVRVPLVPSPSGAVAAPLDPREWLLAQATRARAAGDAGRAACLALLPRAARGRAALEARERDPRVSAWDGLLPPGLSAVLAGHHRLTDAAVAATPLETYATCPFRYYLAHVLGLAPPVEPERVLALTPLDRGRLLHAVLARAYAAFREAGLLPLVPECLPAARPLLETAFAEVEARFGATGLAPFWKGERARLLADVLAALDQEAREGAAGDPWVPTDFEVSFGAGEGGAMVQHTLASGRTLAFRGRLDRLDLSPDGTRARVIDYKAGRHRGRAGARLCGGTALQLPVYRLAAEALCRARGRDARVEEAQYYFLTRRGERRRLRFTDADWTARRADFEQALEGVLDGIAAGRFFQNPSPDTCRTCDYQIACGPERERIAWVAQKLGDPAREAYHRLEGIE